VPPVAIRSTAFPPSLTLDVTPPESVKVFLKRGAEAADTLARMAYAAGNGLAFSHQYTIAAVQDHLYKMTGGDPANGMPHYGEWNPQPTRVNPKTGEVENDPHHNPKLPVNVNGFKSPMEAGHNIPNGATLVRPMWVWIDDNGQVHSVPAPKGFSDLHAPHPEAP
jgi:hypothetical protein